MIPKGLFRYDLAIAAIMKCEAPYIKEWLDYHLLAGVDHFYIYDNESPDNQAEVAKPYVEAGIVDYIPAPGKAMQLVAYNDAVNRFKFHCRYMAFIDGDEFIFPKTGRSILETIDEILNTNPNAAALAVHWQTFGSDGQTKADYSRGVLERFTKRAPKGWYPNEVVKIIFNPRLVDFIGNPHFAFLLTGYRTIDEAGDFVFGAHRKSISADKIVLNHYHCKSREEYSQRAIRGSTYRGNPSKYCETTFNKYDLNQEFDDGILKYRAERAKVYQLTNSQRPLLAAVEKVLAENVADMESLLTCLAVSHRLHSADLVEQSLKAILKVFASKPTLTDLQFLFKSLPDILALKNPLVADFHGLAIKHIPQLLNSAHSQFNWQRYNELLYLQRLLKEMI